MGLIAIGDIHGCAETLDVLVERLAPGPEDTLVFVGDYIDRGPDSKGVIDRLLHLRETHACVFLRGNHEALMLDYLDHGAYDLWRVNGGVATLSSYVNDAQQVDFPEEHLTFVRETKLFHETEDFVFVHAGLRPDLSIAENLAECDEQVFLWERSHLQVKNLPWEKTVVCGHTPQQDPIDRDRLLAIDTGCVYHMHPKMGRLTAVRLPERTFEMVDYVG